jgi:hypothetical protein
LVLQEIPEEVRQLYDLYGRGKWPVPVRQLSECFFSILDKNFDKVWLLADAFDECHTWNALWDFIVKLRQHRRRTQIRFLFTSRPEQHIVDAVDSLNIPWVDLACEEISQDIEKYVSDSIELDLRFKRISKEGKVLVKSSLISRADGM